MTDLADELDAPGAMSPPSVRAVVAAALDLELDEVTDDLRLHDVPEWSSLEHVSLMAAIEDNFELKVDGAATVELISVAAIERFVGAEPSGSPDSTSDTKPAEAPVIHRGLDGVHFDESRLSKIDGIEGELLIRGYPIEDVARYGTFESVCHLLLHGELPNTEQEEAMIASLSDQSTLPNDVVKTIEAMIDAPPTAMLRTVVSQIGAGFDTGRPDVDTALAEGLRLVAMIPSILATHIALRAGRSPQTVDGDVGQAERFLTMSGLPHGPAEIEALDLAMRISVDHGANASTFAARVVASTASDLTSAVTAAIGAFAGPLHGGAVAGAMTAIRTVGEPGEAAPYVSRRRSAGQPVMGFGHRVYRTADPRLAPLRRAVANLDAVEPAAPVIATMEAIEAAMSPFERHGLAINVDTYLAVMYRLLGIPDDHFTGSYAMARIVGWTAQIMEQIKRDVLIRPRLAYCGPARRSWGETR